MKDLTVSILCGGKSSRMKFEKGLVLFRGKPFIEHIIEAILPITNNIKLITNGNEYDHLDYEKINDIEIDKGPLGGIYTALYHCETKFSMILSCDIPLISTELLSELIEKHDDNANITIISSDSHKHPLIGVYSKINISIIRELINQDDLKLMNLIDRIPHQIIKIDKSRNFNCTNINSQDELNNLNTNINYLS